ncbi:MAG: AgmX/PglI C-terminal domain-containing protein [Alphaproteobacteria bacterium]|nr:AgmX/PglI C-terminal domain-containing protein [Alphaproteobacteria bacterium]
MSKLSKAAPLAAALAAVGALLLLNLLVAPEPGSERAPRALPPGGPGPSEAAPPASEVPTPEPEAPGAGAAPEAGEASVRAIPLPRPEAAPSPSGGPELAAPAQRGVVQAEDIRDAMMAVTPEIQACMEDWWALEPELEGRLVMDFTLTPEGLGEVLVLEHDDVPFGVRTCFASAIYEADWPRPPEGELEVTYPFVFTPDDAPPEPDTGA